MFQRYRILKKNRYKNLENLAQKAHGHVQHLHMTYIIKIGMQHNKSLLYIPYKIIETQRRRNRKSAYICL